MIEETVNKSLRKHFSNDVTIRSNSVKFYVQVFSPYSFNKDRNLYQNILKEHLKPVDTNKQIQLNAYYRPCKLGSQFSTRIRRAPLQTSRVLYQLFQCPIDGCNATYLGYTACRLEMRAWQHTYKTSSIYKHYIEDHQLSRVSDDHMENFSILHKNNDVTDLKIIEAILIKQCNPFINVK